MTRQPRLPRTKRRVLRQLARAERRFHHAVWTRERQSASEHWSNVTWRAEARFFALHEAFDTWPRHLEVDQ
jgi:hypothetical protein